jgi:hypothetical protein
MVFLDFDQERIGLHVNGSARIVEGAGNGHGGRPWVERWVEVRVRRPTSAAASTCPTW